MKKITEIFFVFVFLFIMPSYADDSPVSKSSRTFNIETKELYLKSISALNQNKYEILELQSQSGYVLFKAENREYLLSVNGNSVKILPADTNFSGGFSVQENVFKMISDSILKKVP